MRICAALLVLAIGACTKAERRAATPAPPAPLPAVVTPPPDLAGDWFELLASPHVTAKVERALYQAPGQAHFYLHFRISNLTARQVGIDLRYFEALYPNQWGWSDQRERGAIDERRTIKAALTV